MATVAMPLAFTNVSSARSDDQRAWRPKPAISNQKTGEPVPLQLKLVALSDLELGSALTSIDTIVSSRAAEGFRIPSVFTNTIEDQLDFDWMIGSLVQMGELLQVAPEDLPNEVELTPMALAAGALLVFDLQNTGAPPVQVAPRGDGGLQFVWYTPSHDLEFEIKPDGTVGIVEFDGTRTRRSPYSVAQAIAAVGRIRNSLAGVSSAA